LRSVTRMLSASNQIFTTSRAYSNRVGSQESTVQSAAPKTNSNGLDPDKIKGPGGLTMTQIGKLVQESRTKDLEHQAKTKQQYQQPSKDPKH
ncbi:hypothetical protein BGZ65_006034, partial [Modicella reniformis]